MALRTLSICSGIGGLDLGLRLACPQAQTVCYVERDPFAAATLVARMEDEVLDRAPIWSDLTSFPHVLFRGLVDLVIGGIPCQPYAAPGKRLGAQDGRDLWPATARLLRRTGARGLFLENVGRFASHKDGLDRVLRDLAAMGWDAVWGVFSCGALGAPHKRERLFLLAYADSFLLWLKQEHECGGEREARDGVPCASMGHAHSLGRWEDKPSRHHGDGPPTGREEGTNRFEQPGEELADALRSGLEGQRARATQPQFAEPSGVDLGLANTESTRLETLGGGSQESWTWRGRTFWPPGQDPALWGRVPAEFHPATSKHTLRGVDDGVPAWVVESNRYRVDRLRCLGNAVSPPVAAVAWIELTRRVLAQ